MIAQTLRRLSLIKTPSCEECDRSPSAPKSFRASELAAKKNFCSKRRSDRGDFSLKGGRLTGKDMDSPSLRWVTFASCVAICLLCCFPEIEVMKPVRHCYFINLCPSSEDHPGQNRIVNCPIREQFREAGLPGGRIPN